MNKHLLKAVSFGITLVACAYSQTAGSNSTTGIQHVLLISIDGMHAVDFANCSNGIGSVASGSPYCPNLAALATTGVTYTNALTTAPSDSFPGLAAQITGGSPRTVGLFYDVNYDRSLSPPAVTTPYGIPAGYCPGVVGTQVGFDEEIDIDYTQLNGGGGINPSYLPRDPKKNCAPVYPHNYIRTNTIFEVVRENGGYTAWSDKHPAYDYTNGPSGKGVNDLWSPEINSIPVPLASITGCSPLPDPGAATSSNAWTDSFQNIQCYDTLKVQAVINWINGMYHDGSKAAPVPTLFGMNFQSVSVGQKLVEGGVQGGYTDSTGTPTASLLSEIQFVDTQIGIMMTALENKGLLESTMIIISAKHGQSPIDPNRILRVPADNSAFDSPSTFLPSSLVGQALEDDVSLIWLTDQTQTASAVSTLEKNEANFGGGEIYSGASLALTIDDPSLDSRSPDIIVTPNVGVTYTGGKGKVSEHGGFSHDDRNVMMLVSNPMLFGGTITSQVETKQIAPTILSALGLDSSSLQAVRAENTAVLPGMPFLSRHLFYLSQPRDKH